MAGWCGRGGGRGEERQGGVRGVGRRGRSGRVVWEGEGMGGMSKKMWK